MTTKELSDELRDISHQLKIQVAASRSFSPSCTGVRKSCDAALVQIDRLSALALDVEYYESRKRAADFE